MRKKTPETEQIETEDIVRLKPIMGIKPGIYLTVLYSFILLLFLFWLLVYHGLSDYGAVLEIKTEPAGAAVKVNGVYLGTSGTRLPVPNTIKPMENVNIEVSLPGFEAANTNMKIPGRVFGSRFFPRRVKLDYTLTANNSAGVLANAASEYAAWTFGGEPSEAWQIPLVLSEAAYRIGNQSIELNESTRIEYNNILLAASRFAATRVALRDITRAKFLIDNNGNAPSPVAVLGTMQDILAFLSETPDTAAWLANLLPPETAARIRESNWHKNEYESTEEARKRAPSFPDGFGRTKFNLAGLSFTGAPGLLISETPVSKTLFEAFLEENPEWQNSYIDYFKEEATRHPAQVYGDETATGMSWDAATAFCKQLTSRLPSSMAEYEVRLPAGEEWAIAYEYGLIENGNGWEWGIDPFAPINFPANPKAVLAVGSPERTIYSGREPPKPLTRASMPPDFRSPIVTFRPVIAARNGE